MSKRRGMRSENAWRRRNPRADEARRHLKRASPRRLRKALEKAVQKGISRRQLLGYGAGAGMLLGFPGRWGGCGPAGNEPRTLFFNLSHEDFDSTTHHLVVGNNKYLLTKVKDNPRVLAKERRTNKFLRGVPHDQVTHHLENFQLAGNKVQLSYVISGQNMATGTWNMSGMYLLTPPSAVAAAHAIGKSRPNPAGPLLSMKRKRYGHAPAKTAQDLMEEQVFLDTNDHAAALVGMHPEVLSVEPNSCAYVHTHHIATNPFTGDVGDDISQLGAAQPQVTPEEPNDPSVGWATLVPVTDENGVTLKNTTGKNNKGLIHYNAEWNSDLAEDAAQAITGVTQSTKDDTVLGADVTSALGGVTQQNFGGTLWHRRDGIPNIDQSPSGAQAGDNFKFQLTNATPANGFRVTGTATENPDGTVPVTLTLENWYLRWLGVWVQFYDSQGNLVPVANLPESLTHQGNGVNTENAVYFGFVTPEFVIYAIPVEESKATVKFNFPTTVASQAKILASGMGYGSHNFQETEALGIGLTSVFNLIIPSICLGMGLAEGIDAIVKLVAIPAANAAANEFVAFVLDGANNTWPNFHNMLTIFWRSLVRTLTSPGTVNKFLKTTIPPLVEYFGTEEAVDAAEDALPLVGAILQAIGALGTIAEMAETSIEVGLSPWTYENDLVLTHDLSVNILPDTNDNTTPKTANRYQVTALFDSGGTPLVQDVALLQPTDKVEVKFTNVPLGGKVNISAAFVQVPQDPTQDHVVLGKATTGLVDNTKDALDDIHIQELKFPIGPNTQYLHKQKTAVASDSTHYWDPNALAPTTKASDIRCASQGDLCDFYGITVRQGTQQVPGYVGYAWRGNSAGVVDCTSGGQGDSGQLANLNTDSGNNGRNAEVGYAKTRCGLQEKPKLTYSLLTHGTSNFYLDTTHKVIRQVQLDPPSFADPQGNQAYGAFNLDSTSLLLHPAGKLVSINQANHKMETLKLSDKVLSDSDAKVSQLAQLHSGLGTRPGLLTSPVASAISPDGTILVLEAGDSNAQPPAPPRIQAFDTGANPVRFFTKQSMPYYLNLTVHPGATYLDLAVEFTGLLYVLSYTVDADSGVYAYWMDIYNPEQSGTVPLATTQNVNAAKLTVDFWRNVYTLNYEVMQSSRGAAEPSISLWVPTNSCTGFNCTP